MGIPYSIFLILYFAIVAIMLLVSAMSVYHILRFAKMSHGTHASVIVYLILMVGIFALTWWALRGVDWSQTFEIVLPVVTSPLP